MIMAGATVTQMMSSLLKFGVGHIGDVLTKMRYWMEVNEYESLDTMRGSMSYIKTSNPAQFERANYMKVLNSYK
jgi:dihydroorotate dehydrogenase (fumarate)